MPFAPIPVMPAFVLYTNKLVVGAVIVATSVVLNKFMRGSNMPLLVDATSSIALLSGAAPVALIPIF
jgi:hypothetical protein